VGFRRHSFISATAAGSFALAVLAVPALGNASPSCNLIGDSVLPEPAWHAEACAPTAPRPIVETSDWTAWGWAFALDIGFVSDNFTTHDVDNFQGASVIGANALPIFGMDFDETATTLYAVDSTAQQLGTIDINTGVFTAIGPTVPLAGHNLTGLSIDPTTGEAFLSSVDGPVATTAALYTLDLATGTPTLVGTNTTTTLLIDIAIDCTGTLYGHDIATDSLYTIDRATGVPTLIGATGVAANFAQGMDFDNDSGVLYVYAYEGSGTNTYGTANLMTGLITPLAVDDPLGEFEGATQTQCTPTAAFFEDGFESGDVSAWSASAP